MGLHWPTVLFSTFWLQLEKAMAPHSSTLAWKIPWTEEPGGLQSTGSLRIGHDWTTSLSFAGEGNGNPLQCSCLENPRDGGAWWTALYGVTQSRTRLKRLSSSSIQNYTLSCSKHKHSIMYQVPGWGQLCCDIVPSWVLPVHMCVLLSVSVVTVTCSAGGAAPEPGTGQRAWKDRVCFSAALGVLRNCEE